MGEVCKSECGQNCSAKVRSSAAVAIEDAINEGDPDWVSNVQARYLLGSVWDRIRIR